MELIDKIIFKYRLKKTDAKKSITRRRNKMTMVNVKLQLEKSLVYHIIKRRGFKNLDDYLLAKLQDDMRKLK